MSDTCFTFFRNVLKNWNTMVEGCPRPLFLSYLSETIDQELMNVIEIYNIFYINNIQDNAYLNTMRSDQIRISIYYKLSKLSQLF